VETLALESLDEAAAHELLRAVAQDLPLPSGTVQDILRRADGVPLFIEELTRAVAEQLAHAVSRPEPAAGEARDAAATDPTSAFRTPRVPASLHASLIARLDRVAEARPLVEAAAVIGREFDIGLLAQVLDRSAATLGPVLERLAEAELLQRRAAGGFRFRHALIQDAALGLLSRDGYRALHGRVAGAIEAGFPDAAVAMPQRVAHHWTEADRGPEAVAWWLRGADQAMARAAPAEALGQLRRAQALLQQMPETDAWMRQALDLELRIGNALLLQRGHGAPETGQAYDRALALSERLPGMPQRGVAMHGQWSHAWMGGRIGLSLERAAALLRLAEEGTNPAALTIGHSAMAHSLFMLGRFAEARASAEHSLRYHDPADRRRRHDVTLQTTVISTRVYGAWARMLLGDTAAVRDELDQTLAAAERSGVPFAEVNAAYAFGFFDCLHGDHAAALARLRDVQRLSAAQGVFFIELASRAMVGVLLGRLGDPASGLDQVRPAIAGARAANLVTLMPHFIGLDAELLALGGDPEGGLARVTEAIGLMQAAGTVWEAAPLHLLQGDILARLGQPAAAVAEYRAAQAIAAKQGAALFTLEVARRLAPLLPPAEARALLAAALAPYAAVGAPVVERAQGALAALA
jgi:tetratricopeptide (TPR) repeat protein